MSQPPFPVEEFRALIRAFIKWAMYEPPGEAVSGKFDLAEFQPQPDQETKDGE